VEDRGVQRDPFDELAEMRQTIGLVTENRGPDGERLAELGKVGAALETVYYWAVEMQLGAEGFDNTASARAYSDIQEHLGNAAREIAQACVVLQSRDSA
jgi:hypothetical protein